MRGRIRQALRQLGADLSLLDELADSHRLQWRLEDESRDAGASDTRLARVKREIDERNAARYHLVERFDRSLTFPEARPGARLLSETPGELCDRLLILDLKLECAADPEPGQRFQAWRDHLERCLLQALEDLAGGRAVAPPRYELKQYAPGRCLEPAPGPSSPS